MNKAESNCTYFKDSGRDPKKAFLIDSDQHPMQEASINEQSFVDCWLWLYSNKLGI